jgi:hypothetical protein
LRALRSCFVASTEPYMCAYMQVFLSHHARYLHLAIVLLFSDECALLSKFNHASDMARRYMRAYMQVFICYLARYLHLAMLLLFSDECALLSKSNHASNLACH